MELYVGGSNQGKYEYAKKIHDEKNIWNDFHLFVKSKIMDGLSVEEIEFEIEEKIISNPALVIISNELGCGVVPFDKDDRMYREITGRLLCRIAEKAESVYRITCGIAQRIK